MTKTTSQKLYIARGFFAALAGILALATLITLGMGMDYANFPGSNLVLDSYGDNDNAGRTGLIKLVDGFQLKNSTCSNFRTLTNTEPSKICASVKDDAAVALEVVNEKGDVSDNAAHGWLLGPPCVKTGSLSDCAPFGFGSPLSGLGQAAFGALAINVILYGTHTGYMSESKTSKLFVLNVLWTIVAFSLYVWAAVAWGAVCDKIDTGLGRYVVVAEDNVPACATSYCWISFGGLTASFASAITFAHLPNIITFFGLGGLSEDISEKYKQYRRLKSGDGANDEEDV
tara:strand:- start:11065 stop:11922 length:858 start_codon:yes stop_codon:yes gene_type:complete